MVRAIFLMEQHLGHQTYYENVYSFGQHEPGVSCSWVKITYKEESKLLDLTPGIPTHVRGTLQGMMQVRRALTRGDYDVAFFNTQVPAALAKDLVQRKPYLLATDITPVQYDQMGAAYGHHADGAGPWSEYKHWVNTSLFQEAAYVLPWSSWTRDSLIHDYQVDPARITVVPPGIDLQRWRPEKQRTSHGPLRILFVGGDFERKGGATLLRAFQQMPAGLAEVHVVTRSEISPQTGVHIHPIMRPNSAELIALYQSADLFVLPSQAEAFGIAAIEASAVGLPLITTRLGGLRDILREGETGFGIEPGDWSRLQHLLLMFARDPNLRLRMGRAARQRAEQYFDAQKNTARIFSYLRRAAQANQHIPSS